MVKVYNNEKIGDLKGLCLLDFYAEWCGPCKMLSPVLESLEDIEIYKINVDNFEELAKEYKVMSIPNMFIVKDGEIVKQLVGFKNREELLEEIERVK